MREIKFRAFDTYTNRIVSWEEIKESCELDSFFDLVSFEKVQFTGLKDCNGEDIYEGDIIQDDEFYVSHIYWCDETHMWACTDIGGLCDVPSEVKVIGNIYQNPELLEASK